MTSEAPERIAHPSWTPRQKQVLDLLARGRTNGQIGEALGISLDGAKWHVSEVMGKLGVDSREAAAAYWREYNGLGPRLARVFRGLFVSSGLRWAAGIGGIAIAVVATIALVFSLGGDDQSAATGEATPTPTVTADAGASPTTAVVAPGSQPLEYCFVDLPDTWATAFAQHEIPRGDDQRLSPVAAAADGSRLFGSLYSPGWSGVVSISVGGDIVQIREFDDPSGDQMSGASFDGRWLIWTEYPRGEDSELRAWDSETGEIWDIARAVYGPVSSDGKAAWLQRAGPAGWTLHLYSFADRTDQVLVDENAVAPVLFWGSNVIWAVEETPGERRGHFEMLDLATGQRATPPGPLASLTRLGNTAAQGDLVAWTEDNHSILIWRQGDDRPTKIVPPGLAPMVDWIAIAGDLVTWSGEDRQWAADTRSGSVAPITTQYGDRFTNGDTLVVVKPIGPLKVEGQRVPLLKVSMLDATALPPLPGCP